MQLNSPADRNARDQRDDFCEMIFERIARKFGNDFRLDIEPEPLQTVSAVWHATGILLNGGFSYLFEGSFTGDSDFGKTRLAFLRIGASRAVNAFDRAFSCFPDGKPLSDVRTRANVYRLQDPKVRQEIDNCFFDAEEEIRDHLASFIRHELETIESLLGDPSR